MNELLYFSKKHEFEENKDYKEKWVAWVEENNEMIQKEEKRLMELGYQGDILDKMYKSSRYYFRKKSLSNQPPKTRCQYISLSKEWLNKIDEFILQSLQLNKRPKDSYIEFLQLHSHFCSSIVIEMQENGIEDIFDMDKKIKKTYKNRYFMLKQLR